MAKKVTNTMIADAPEVIAYGMMNGDFVSYLAMSLSMYQGGGGKCINTRWNCPGGSVLDGVAAYNSFHNSKVPVHAYVDGVAASMGYYSILGAAKIFISKFGRVMLHEAKGGGGGTASEMRDDADLIESCDATLIAMVCARTGMTEDVARATFFNGKDNWYGAREALRLGLVDGIYDIDEVDVPEAASHTEVYALISEWSSTSRAGASPAPTSTFNQSLNIVPMTNKMTPEALAELGLTASATDTEINAALINRNSLLSRQLAEQENKGKKEQVGQLLTAALNDQKITAEFKTVLEGQYATNPDGLKQVLAAMPAFKSVSDAVNVQATQRQGAPGTYAPHVNALMSQGWDALDRSNQLKALKAADINAYTELYKTKFGYVPNGKPKPAFVERDIANR